ncbi:hypothetical protein D3C76_1682230 [compost metagenome]
MPEQGRVDDLPVSDQAFLDLFGNRDPGQECFAKTRDCRLLAWVRPVDFMDDDGLLADLLGQRLDEVANRPALGR